MKRLDFIDQAAQIAASVDPHQTRTNPRVGCLLVQANQIIGQGSHEKFGEAHAEVNALKTLIPGWHEGKGQNHPGMKDCSVYLTLEPCVACAGKKTPACSDLLIQLKPAQVFIGALDPHFPGQGVTALKQAGITVTVLNTSHHKNLNPWFETWIKQKQPFITLKVAQSLDGKVTPPLAQYKTGQRALTGAETQRLVHNLRANHQAILTSTETILEDDPKLDVRHAENLPFKPSAPDVIIVGKRALLKTAHVFQTQNRKVHFLKNLSDLVPYCAEHNIASIMTECGGTLNSVLLETGLVNQIELFTAPIFCGETAKPSFKQPFNLKNFELKSIKKSGSDSNWVFQKPLS